MGSWSYVSLTALKAQLADTETTDDAVYRQKLEAASAEIDRRTGRTFRVYLATIYPPVRGGRLLLAQDILAVTSLKSSSLGDRVYDATWAATDYDLEPWDAVTRRAPYWEIRTTPNGAYSFPCSDSRGVELAAKLGYWEDLQSVGTIAEDLDATETGVDMTAGHGLEALQTILVGSEQMYITAISTNTLTVERGVNGTTAATHSNTAAVQRYRYPAEIVSATSTMTEELLRPFGRTGEVDDAQDPHRAVLPAMIDSTLAEFRLARVA